MPRPRLLLPWIVMLALGSPILAADGNRLTYLDEPCDPYYPGLATARLTTPQWIGEAGVEAAVILSIDDLVETQKYEEFIRPILQRLKRIDGRAPLSLMAKHIDPGDPLAQKWLAEGVSLEAHTYDHPCPCLQENDAAKAKETYDRCVDLMRTIPNGRTLAFRMPCCDSMNSASPRFFTEIFNRTTPLGNYLSIDASVFVLFTLDDAALPRGLVRDAAGRQRFPPYAPPDRKFVNMIENYPYPYVIARLCWELPNATPDDWQGFHLHGACDPRTLADIEAAIEATVIKQGLYVLTFHPHHWIRNDQVVDVIDHVVGKYGKKVKFLNFREAHERLTANLLGGQPLRAANGQDNGVRLLDLNHDGFMDVVIGNEKRRQTRLWDPHARGWKTGDFPLPLVTVDAHGNRRETGVRFGVLGADGNASLLVRNEQTAGAWHFDGRHWAADPQGLAGLELDGPVLTSRDGQDRGVRLRDLDGDGVCELIVGNDRHSGVFQWSASRHAWQRLPFALPEGTAIVDARGRDAGLRFVDVDEDGRADVVFSNASRYSVSLFRGMTEGWSRPLIGGPRGDGKELPMIVRGDGSNNGAWFKYRHLWVQNEETGHKMSRNAQGKELIQTEDRYFVDSMLVGDIKPPPRSPQESLHSLALRPGFKAELAAQEPQVMDPIDIAWGPDGKAWVVEMADYPLGIDNRGKPGGRIRILEDTHGNGVYDKSTVFLEPVPFPTSIMPWRKGVIIAAAPEIFYAEDTDGDGRADVHRTLFSGFRQGNQQHRVNHLRWGLDNWVYAANGDSGGLIQSQKTGQLLDISGRDLRFRPDEGLIDPQTGSSQFGRNRDDWGNWFGCNNNNPGWFYALADHYLRRNPYMAGPSGRVDLTDDRASYPTGRVITHCFIDQPTPPEGQPGRWTAVASAMIYRDELFGPEFAGNLFVDDSVYNCVHRLVLAPDGVLFRGNRGPDEEHREFLGSNDPWFRPTTLQTGPDGALWVVDMYRFVIEHPEWIDVNLVKKLDLRAGHDKGRIYRVFPVDKRPRAIPRLDKLPTPALVAALDSPNGWQRDMVQQMLLWNVDKGAVQPLEALVFHSPRALTRLHALCALDGLAALRPEVVLRGLADENAGVRRHAVRLSETLFSANPAVGEAVVRLAGDADPQVRMQVAYSLGEWRDPLSGRTLARMAMRDGADPYLLAAVMSSAVPHVAAMRAEVEAAGAAQHAGLLKTLQKLAADIRQRPDLAKPRPAAALSVHRPLESNRSRVEKVLGRAATVTQVQKTLAKYSPVLHMFGDPERGKKLFVEATCSICHRFQGIGQEIGPDLETLVDRSPETLSVAVIDPNRAVLDRYVEYIAVTDDGLSHNGMLVEEGSNSLTLVNRDGKKEVILRKDLDELIFTGRSHMPEGLEAKLDLQQMADLFAFVGGKGPPPRQLPGNRPELVRVSDDGSLVLAAAAAEIYGPDVKFDSRQQSITNWTSRQAYAGWPVQIIRVGEFDVWLDRACADRAAGGRFVLQVDQKLLRGQVASTGGWDNYRSEKIGHVQLGPGKHYLALRAEGELGGPLMNVRAMRLLPAASDRPATLGRTSGAALTAVKPGPDGSLSLDCALGRGVGPNIRYQPEWKSFGYFMASDRVEWLVDVAKASDYEAWLEWSVDDKNAGHAFVFLIGDQRLEGAAGTTGAWESYHRVKLGRIHLRPGQQRAALVPSGRFQGALLDLRRVQLVPVAAE
jgi:putative membrane-bound dehydrogenase-like protein